RGRSLRRRRRCLRRRRRGTGSAGDAPAVPCVEMPSCPPYTAAPASVPRRRQCFRARSATAGPGATRSAFGGRIVELCSCHSLRGIAARHDWPHDSAMTDTATLIQQFNEAFLLRAPERLDDIITDYSALRGCGPAPAGDLS